MVEVVVQKLRPRGMSLNSEENLLLRSDRVRRSFHRIAKDMVTSNYTMKPTEVRVLNVLGMLAGFIPQEAIRFRLGKARSASWVLREGFWAHTFLPARIIRIGRRESPL